MKYRIDKYTDSDMNISFSKSSGSIKPVSYLFTFFANLWQHSSKEVEAKLMIRSKNNKTLRVPMQIGDDRHYIDVIIRCDAGLFDVDPSTLPTAIDEGIILHLNIHSFSRLPSACDFSFSQTSTCQ